jgi:hypothetical protein
MKQAHKESIGFVITEGFFAVPVGIVLSKPEKVVIAQSGADTE